MTGPLVSFLVPCFNYGRYLGECLDSIFGQRAAAPFEVIATGTELPVGAFAGIPILSWNVATRPGAKPAK